MRRISSYAFLLTLFFLATATSCNKDKEPDAVPFNKAALLTNVADNLIIPAIDDFATRLNTLKADYIQFQGDLTAANLDIVRNSWKEAYLSWQGVKMYDFGPIRDLGFKGSTGTFPCDTTKIENNISAGSYNLASASNADAIGLPALDFLLYRTNALSFFVGSSTYTTYGLDLIEKMATEIMTVKNNWVGYRATFVSSTGTETTSAFSQMVNEFNRDYELAKNAKVGIPLGTQTLGIQRPEYIEARKSAFSFELLKRSIEKLEELYNGANGTGFDDYLKHLDKSSLNSTISSNFNDIINKINSFSGTFEQEMTSNASGLDELYTLLQGQVVYLKTDMTSSFGVLITYQDNDGD